jgi:tetratricopeptide (TPR) repeat protein
MMQRFGQTDNPEQAHWVAWTCALNPDTAKDYRQLVQLAEKSLRADPKNHNFSNALGGILYRSGRFEEAIQCLNEINSTWEQGTMNPAPFSPAYSWFFLAMAHHQLGHTQEARQWLDKAIKQMEEETKTKGLPWNRRLTLQLLSREAETLLKRPGELQSTPKKERAESKAAEDQTVR